MQDREIHAEAIAGPRNTQQRGMEYSSSSCLEQQQQQQQQTMMQQLLQHQAQQQLRPLQAMPGQAQPLQLRLHSPWRAPSPLAPSSLLE